MTWPQRQSFVMAGLDPAIHVFLADGAKTWMPGTRPGMTRKNAGILYYFPSSKLTITAALAIRMGSPAGSDGISSPPFTAVTFTVP